MASPNASAITGSELIRITQDGQPRLVNRTEMNTLVVLAGVINRRFLGQLTERSGVEGIVALQGGQRIEMSAADFATYLTATGPVGLVPFQQRAEAFTGRERVVINQGRLVSVDLAQFAYIRGVGGSLAGYGDYDPPRGSGGTPTPTPTSTPTPTPAAAQNIASAMRGPGFQTATLSNGTDTAFNSVKWWYNDSGVDAPAPLPEWLGWGTGIDANPELDMTGNGTINSTVEYPAGTRTAYTFGGNPTGTLPAGGQLRPDGGASAVMVPAGQWAATHTRLTVASGVKVPLVTCSNNFGGGRFDYAESGAAGTLADKTASGAPTTSVPGFFPAAILSVVTGARPAYAAFGDSHTAGAGDDNYDAANNTGWIARGITGKGSLIHMGVTGTSLASQVGNISKRLAFAARCGVKKLFFLYGANDVPNRTAAAIMADWQTIANQATALGMAVYGYTLWPRLTGTSADKWESIGTQTVAGGGFTAGSGSVRAAYNALVRSKPSPMVDYIEAADSIDVDATNTLTRDGGFLLVGPSSRLDGAVTGSVQAGATTTVIPTGTNKPASYFASFSSGYIRFTSGALAGTVAAISNNDASGNMTLVAALASAPATGDTFSLTSRRVAATGDGTHLLVADLGNGFGSHFRLRDVASAKIATFV